MAREHITCPPYNYIIAVLELRHLYCTIEQNEIFFSGCDLSTLEVCSVSSFRAFYLVGNVKSCRTGKIGIATADGRTVTHDTITEIGNCKIDDYDTVVELKQKITRRCEIVKNNITYEY